MYSMANIKLFNLDTMKQRHLQVLVRRIDTDTDTDTEILYIVYSGINIQYLFKS